ncbi:MAG TPA: GDP-L-fucose synthase [Terriglobales bacterium]|nr:GDP-L-fucose synthase [Terriglobales bacterium]
MSETTSFWPRARVLVTGGAGFVGSRVVEKLRQRQCDEIFAPRSKDYDLRNREHVEALFEQARPSLVIHLAATVGGIGGNQKNPARFFFDNAMMGIQLLDCAARFQVEKFVCIGTVCSYPKFTPVPFKEEHIWDGYPEDTNAPYGLAKKMLLVQAQAYRQQYGLNAIYLIPTNLYGPGDNFDPEMSHVIPALIRKCAEAKQLRENRIVAWGTGNASREFLYVEDAAEGIILGAESYNQKRPVNLGSGKEVTIRNLASLIASETGFEGAIEWDNSKPDGQPRRRLDTTRAKQEFGFEARTDLQEGLRETIRWYQQSNEAHRPLSLAPASGVSL